MGHQRDQVFSCAALLALFWVMFGFPKPAFAKDLGTFGTTYAIAEPDALDEIERRAKAVDWGKIINKKTMEKAVKSYRPSGLKKIGRAEKDRTVKVSMVYTLQSDIPDGRGGILYPHGYRFNPLEHLFLPNIIVIINGNDPEQVLWFQSSRYAERFKVSLLLTEGDYAQLSNQLSRPVYYADGRLLDRLSIHAVPSVAMQKGTLMEVKEIAIPQKK
ncbi:MAG: hypothetical protein ACE5GK_12805 [Nitrospiria bacterium]